MLEVKVGDKIRGLDFEFCTDKYIEGTVVAIEPVLHPVGGFPMYDAYHINIEVDSPGTEWEGRRVGDVGYIPVETMMDFDGRVTKL